MDIHYMPPDAMATLPLWETLLVRVGPLRGAFITFFAVFIGAYWLRSLLFRLISKAFPPLPDLPSMPKPAGQDYRETMRQGMEKVGCWYSPSHNTLALLTDSTLAPQYRGQAWLMPFQEPTVILPPDSLESQVKKIPEPDLTLNGNMYRRFFGRYTQIGTDDDELIAALRRDLTHSVPSLSHVMAEEVAYGYDHVVGPLPDWKPCPTYQTMLQIVALTSGRVFVGLPLSRDPAWVRASIEHTTSSVHLSDRLRGYPPWLRVWVAPFLPERRQVQAVQETFGRLLEPVIAAARSGAAEGSSAPNGAAKPESRPELGRMTRWLLVHYARNSAAAGTGRLVRDHLTLAFAAVHVASMVLTHVLHDLAARPQYLGILRNELETELQACGGNVLDSKALGNLVIMDSFIKESLRINPPGVSKLFRSKPSLSSGRNELVDGKANSECRRPVSWFRLTTVPIHLSNGQVIPENTMVAYCNPRFDPGVDKTLDDPAVFDGLRFARTGSKLEALSIDSLAFGYGIHACPGRSFAVAELKLIVAHLVRNYDICLEAGKPRPENIPLDFQLVPNPEGKVLLRSRVKK